MQNASTSVCMEPWTCTELDLTNQNDGNSKAKLFW